MANVVAETQTARGAGQSPIRVMVVDDSAVIRGLLTRTLEADPDITIVASVGNGQMAISAIARQDTDVVILDIEMPVMDGLTALPKILAAAPDVKVIVASTLTQKNAQISLKAMSAGAADYLAKPSSSELNAATAFKRELIDKVKALGDARRRRRATTAKPATAEELPFRPVVSSRPTAPTTIALRAASAVRPSVIAIGSSTGGPQALLAVLGGLPASVQQPIIITQHMPPTFTTILAQHLSRASGRQAAEGVDGEAIVPGRIYLAPGDFHMKVEARGAARVIRLAKDPPENFCRPAVDPMLRSLSEVYGSGVLCVILTGMGADGTKGGEAVIAAGGTVIAQDEATSVVWGMPGAAAAAGICSAILPISHIAPHIVRLAGGGRA
ncbi:MAG TPA: chemotaxis response regulator protein-glutamate methylesterase [Alphaproteobacteria bacterium]|nr:chemotaxis response regulator protein-glutamate methylesterase [Alphaproteobacteria bacterium]